jgi:hypothetical protein
MVEIQWHSQTKERDNSEHKHQPTPARQSSTLPARAAGREARRYSPNRYFWQVWVNTPIRPQHEALIVLLSFTILAE